MYLQKRDGLKGGMVAVPIILAVVVLAVIGFLYYKKRWPKSVLYVPKKQKSSNSDSKSSSRLLNFLRHGFRTSKSSSHPNDQEIAYAPSTHSTTETTSVTEMTATTDAPNRNRGSLRSILTLPTYNPSPRADEQLIAREGERAGVDTVIEYPETLDEEEARREADMAALYEIRQARRREIDDRNARRRARAEARAQGDWARLEQFRLEDLRRQRARAQTERERSGSGSGSSLTLLPTASISTMPELGVGGNASSQSLIAEHNARTGSRDRRVSSVSYADLGLARHDGSRLRENSMDSDHRPLLEGAAFMGSTEGGSGSNSRRGSLFTNPPPSFQNGRSHHHRGASAESVVTTESDLVAAGGGPPGTIITPQTSSSGERSNSNSDPTILTPNGGASASASASEPSPPMEDPPGYEDAPPYTSPVAERGEGRQLPSLSVEENNAVPRIEIEASTPTVGRLPGGFPEEE